MVRRLGGRTGSAAARGCRLRVAAAVLLLVVAACASDDAAVANATTPSAPTSVVTVEADVPVTTTVLSSVAPTTLAASGVAPLTGLPADPSLASLPVLAVKIDNAPQAWPQAGLNDADIVFEENVEGWTRFVALVHSTVPTIVGPIRSARTQDVDILTPLGRPVLLWSGGNPTVQAAISSSAIVDASVVATPDAYDRDASRRPPHDLFARPGGVLSIVGAAQEPVRALFMYAEFPSAMSTRSSAFAGVDLRMAGGMEATWRWNETEGHYVRTQQGEPHVDTQGRPVTTTNIVIALTDYRPSAADVRSPEAVTTGTGEVIVLTGGRAVTGLWARPEPSSPWTLVAQDGSTITLRPGRTWVELVEADQFAIIGG
jgi:hypothetical protein